ncbi:MAG: hydroxymethylbilane synthase [Brooklawnia sp.]|jgi:hydroxymethylbilane synthase
MSARRVLRLGTRGSRLATTQSQTVADALTEATGWDVELVVIRAEGDDLRIALDSPPRPGAFVASLRDALLTGHVDLVVHSFKDLPSAPLPGAVVAAVPERVDARDVLCARDGLGLMELPSGARIGTSSPRRAAALLRAREDLTIVPIRGNVDTRLGKIASGEVDATVLAGAGLLRLGRENQITEWLDPDRMLPAPAQGALAVECRTGTIESELAVLDDLHSRQAVTAERAVLAGIEAECTTAVGAHARWVAADQLLLVAELTGHRGVGYARVTRQARVSNLVDAERLGAGIADELLAG